MMRLACVCGSALVASLVCAAGPAAAQTGRADGLREPAGAQVARALSGSIEGNVIDELGQPLPGVTVSALGATSAVGTTDRVGYYRLRALPPGPYLVRAHVEGYLASRREVVKVNTGGASRHVVSLRRLGPATGPSGVAAPRVLAAGFSLTASARPQLATDGIQPDTFAAAADPDEVSWRLRHLTRSVLKSASEPGSSAAPSREPPAALLTPEQESPWVRAVTGSLRTASLIASLPLSGEVRLLTAGALDGPDSVFSPATFGSGIAYLSLTGPVWGGADWSAQAVLTQGASGSWFLATNYRRREPAAHRYDTGFVYSVQRFTAGPRTSLAGSPVGSRSALSAYGYDRWTLGRSLQVDYGAHFARYGYLEGFGLLSPRLSVTITPVPGFRVRSLVGQRMLAPGAEEFLQPLAAGLWVPPGRTFVDTSLDHRLDAEQARHVEVSVERDLPAGTAISVRRFRQQVQSQQAALFGTGVGGWAGFGLGHYVVSRAGDLDANGWSVGLTNAIGPWLRGEVKYEVTDVDWVGPPDTVLAASWAAVAGEDGVRRFHDLTTSITTDIPFTATRVLVFYKVNSAFAHADGNLVRPAFESRFDFQVTQRLPFLDFAAAEWQVLVAVRNLFREATVDSSVFDELFVVRPPKRVVGGVLVRF